MKNIKHSKRYGAYLILLITLLAGCGKDFITQPPQDTIVDANFYKTADQVLAGSAPLYNVVWFAYNDKASHGLGDGRGGVLTTGSYQIENIQFKTTGITGENGSAWRAFYNVVGQSNTLINNINRYAGPDVPKNIKEHAIAEARFMRGLAYYFLVSNWGPVPIITDNATLLQDTTISRNTVESIWDFICRDMRYSATHLPETPIQVGRLFKYSAEGMLAKMYLTRAGLNQSLGSRDQVFLDSAKYLAKDVIDNSGASLMANYEDLYLTANNNNPESLFALQWVYNGPDWGSQNSVQAFLAYGSSITGFADGWGGDLGASMYMLKKYEGLVSTGSTPDLRRKGTFMLPGDHYSYIHQQLLDANGNPFTQELRVPIGGSGYNTRAWVKKYVVGRPEDNGGKVTQQHTGNNTYMLRLADVYLIYAEAILGNANSTSDAEALTYYTKVRNRAGLDLVTPKTSITWGDIFKERQLEFAMEGQMWYDFVRYSYYNKQGAYDSLANQDRGFYFIWPNTPVDPTKWKIRADSTRTLDQRYYPVNDGNFHLPIPSTELSRAPNLKKEPVTYVFK